MMLHTWSKSGPTPIFPNYQPIGISTSKELMSHTVTYGGIAIEIVPLHERSTASVRPMSE